MMNRYKIPMGSFEAWIGSRYHAGRDGEPRPLLEEGPQAGAKLYVHIGKRVLIPANLVFTCFFARRLGRAPTGRFGGLAEAEAAIAQGNRTQRERDCTPKA